MQNLIVEETDTQAQSVCLYCYSDFIPEPDDKMETRFYCCGICQESYAYEAKQETQDY